VDSFKKYKIIIVGAGPAGITAGCELLKNKKIKVFIFEKESIIGGLAKTVEFKGCKFDIGPHHFITVSDWVEKWWKALMKKDFHLQKRFTRIFYNNHFFHYPLEPLNVIRGLSFFECFLCIASYVKSRLFPIKNVKTFEDWISNRFGHRLFSIFFKTYTEKVWGVKCDTISSDWASQRIKGFSLSKAIFYAFFSRWYKKNAPRTLCDTFYYPSQGSGDLWEKAARKISYSKDGFINTNHEVVTLHHNGKMIASICTKDAQSQSKTIVRHDCDYILSTMPLRHLIMSLHPKPSDMIIKAAQQLQYRGLITVNLIIDKVNICPDHWLYVHEKKVKMGRIGNMNNFSLSMVDSKDHTALALEYFSFVDDDFWKKSNEELIELGKQELEKIGFIKKYQVLDGMILRSSEAYPMYDKDYKSNLLLVLTYLEKFENLYLMGRNGMHRYNNMDIAMLSAKKVVDDISIVLQNDFIARKKKERFQEQIFR
jgi:protoporphyrinogen oxidase